MPDLLPFDAITPADAGRVGGKGFSLGRLAAAGLPVPPGFVVTTDAYCRLHAAGPRSDPAFAQALLDAYRALGGGPVAVRSSATAEDGAEASFAGQQDTILGVAGDDALLEAVARCWGSLHAERAVAYRRQRNIPDDGLAMAVVVQRLVPADVAGVLFTRDPQDPTGRATAVEAAWGLGEVVVSGRVTPDRFRLDRDTGAALERHAGHKAVKVTAAGEEPVPLGRQDELCLSDGELSRLAELGRRVEAFYGEPRDVEWALAGGAFHLLQARPITAATAAEREAVRGEVIAELRAQADPRGTVWARYNLSEVLPEPAPMTWAVVQRLLAADGGFGALYRDLGSEPDPALGSESAYDLVAGRPLCNLSRLPRLQFARPPVEYPFTKYKADPRQALDPKPVLRPVRGGLGDWLRLPATVWRLFRLTSTARRLAETFAAEFPAKAEAFAAEARAALAQDWSKLDPPAVKAEFDRWVAKTLVEFARDSLKPTVLANVCWEVLTERLTPALGAERARAAVAEVALGAKPPEEADVAGGVTAFAKGELDRAAFLARFGHRGRNEMELAAPRWGEDPGAVDQLQSGAKARGQLSPGLGELVARIAALAPTPADTWDRVAAEAKLTGPARDTAARWADRLRTYLGLREAGKHALLLGYAVIRRALVELDARLKLNGGVFYLLPTELDELLAGADLSAKVAARKKRRRIELSLEVPAVLFSDDLDAVGRPAPVPEGATLLEGTALSAGTAEAAALVLTEPTAAPPGEPYILVCPSTDPAWVPLFAGAVGLVMEAGGVLSHGAIVAREFGLPAVAGLPDATRRLRTGQRLRVDGARGTVAVLE